MIRKKETGEDCRVRNNVKNKENEVGISENCKDVTTFFITKERNKIRMP
jgi:hypothetical protein